jgi:hypothetical protein
MQGYPFQSRVFMEAEVTWEALFGESGRAVSGVIGETVFSDSGSACSGTGFDVAFANVAKSKQLINMINDILIYF